MNGAEIALATAVADVWQWAYFEGYAEEGAEPPDIDLNALAAYVRLLLDQARLNADGAAERLRAEEENRILRQQALGYAKELQRLRDTIERMCSPPPWEEEEFRQPQEGTL